MVLRLMRSVSFHPWGSLRADGDRRQKRVNQITEKIWVPNPFAHKIRMFVAGGGVLWTPVAVKDGRIRTPDRIFTGGFAEDSRLAWLASRQPPLRRSKLEAMGQPNPLEVNITPTLVQALKAWKNGASSTFEILYDCRFIVTFNMEKMPEKLANRIMIPETKEKYMIYPNSRWYWPQVVREWFSLKTILHSKIEETTTSLFLPNTQTEVKEDYKAFWKPREEPVSSKWIDIKWIRPLDAI
jgi:tRNA(Ile)-lysidine synthase